MGAMDTTQSSLGGGGGPAGLRLLVTTGNALGARIQVEDELVLGRHSTADGQLGGDPELSRRHARVSRAEAGLVVEDLGSTNGTFVNGSRIDSPQPLVPGDRVEVGETTLTVEAVAEGPPDGEPEAVADDTAEQAGSVATAEVTLGKLAVQLEIDFDAREARVGLGDGPTTMRLIERDGHWVVEST
jgi:pSer/pThr/pTyr-binding forkhead associated (FHA) protein